jgi:hypothetical protein
MGADRDEDGRPDGPAVTGLIETAWECVSRAHAALALGDVASATQQAEAAIVSATRALVAARGLSGASISNLGAARAASVVLVGGVAGDIVSSVERIGGVSLHPSEIRDDRDSAVAHHALMSSREFVALIESEVSR